MYSIKLNLSVIPYGREVKTQTFATEGTEHTEFFSSSLRDVGWALSTIPHVGQCPTYTLPLAMTEKACNQNIFFPVCSVPSVANNNTNRYSVLTMFPSART